ncbi:sigma-70 family RNA polymerase sigma factor [soil metagenome]
MINLSLSLPGKPPASYMTTEEIIRGCIEGKRAAQNKLYEHYHGRMLGVCLRYAGSKDEAKEIMNIGFLKVFQTINRFEDGLGNIDAWIYRVMVNTSIDYYRKELKHRYQDDVDNHYHIQDESADAISEMSMDELIKLVQTLSPAYRTVFNLYVIDGFSHKEIADQLGISEGTSKSNLAKARMNLQEMIRKRETFKSTSYAG